MARPRCPRCERPLSVCYCQGLTSRVAPVDLLVLQHPSEVKKAVGTARLLSIGYSNCRLEVGESFVDADWLAPLLEQYRDRCWVLFPRENAVVVDALPPLSSFKNASSDHHGPEQGSLRPLVILLDGTWRKAQKIGHLNPWLHQLPAIALNPEQPSRYRIRKAPRADSLSTVEAAISLLRQWSGNPEEGTQLLDAFEKMIDQQIAAMGSAVYQQNYPH